MRSDIFIALALMAMFGGYYAMADALPSSLMDTQVTSADTPRLIAVAGIVLSLLLIVQSVFTMRRQAEEETSPPAAPPDDETDGGHWRAFAMLGIGAAFILLLPYLGYALSLVLLFAAVAAFRAGQLTWGIVVFAIITAIAFHLIFVELLHVRVPAGILAPLLG